MESTALWLAEAYASAFAVAFEILVPLLIFGWVAIQVVKAFAEPCEATNLREDEL